MNAVPAVTDNSAIMERVLLAGDLSKLSTADRLFYYGKVCESVGLNPLTRPFDYLTLNGKMVLYAKRDATDQLRRIHGVSVTIKARENIEGVYVVTANARDKGGREDESTGAVSIGGLKGDVLANALMKAETKAKRRVTLSICGLGMLDETEIDTIAGARAENGNGIDHPPNVLTNEARDKYLPLVKKAIDKSDSPGLRKILDEVGEGPWRGLWSFLSSKQKTAARDLLQQATSASPTSAAAYVERFRQAMEVGSDERIAELHTEVNEDATFAMEVTTLMSAQEVERINEAVDRMR